MTRCGWSLRIRVLMERYPIPKITRLVNNKCYHSSKLRRSSTGKHYSRLHFWFLWTVFRLTFAGHKVPLFWQEFILRCDFGGLGLLTPESIKALTELQRTSHCMKYVVWAIMHIFAPLGPPALGYVTRTFILSVSRLHLFWPEVEVSPA